MGRRLSTWKRFLTIAAAAAVMALPGIAGAADNSWTGAGGDGLWSTDGNWSLGHVPLQGETVYLNSSGTITYSGSPFDVLASDTDNTIINHSSGTLTLPSGDSGFVINSTGTGSAVYNLSGDALLVKGTYEIKIGTDGTGLFKQSGGTFQMSSAMYLGDRIGGIGTYTMTGGVLEAGPGGLGSIVLGEWGGKGYFNQSGESSVTLKELGLARQVALTYDGAGAISGDVRSYGYYQLDGGTLTTIQTNVGIAGDGSFVQTGGTHATGSLTLGSGVASYQDKDGNYTYIALPSRGEYTLSGGSLDTSGTTVGELGEGVFTQTVGTHTVAGDLILGNNIAMFEDSNGTSYNSPSSGQYSLSGGDLSTANTIIGNSSTGYFTQSGGTHTISGVLTLGQADFSSGTYNLSDGTLTVGMDEIVGVSGAGQFVQEAGTHAIGGNLVLGNDESGYGWFYLDGGSLSVAGESNIGLSGGGNFEQTGGKHNVGGDLNIGYEESGYGIYRLSGGDLVVAGATRVGYKGAGSFTQTGGTHTVGAALVLGNDAWSGGEYTLEGGTLNVGYVYGTDGELAGTGGGTTVGMGETGTFTQSGGTHRISGGLTLGQEGYSAGKYYLNTAAKGSNDGELLVGGHEHIGMSGAGEFHQGAGTHTVGGDLVLGNNADGFGDFYLDSGSLSVGGITYLGMNGAGTFYHTGGTYTVGTFSTEGNLISGGDLNLGQNEGSTGEYNMTGTGVINVGGNLYVGVEGTGTFNQNGGTVNTGEVIVKVESGGNGTYNMSGGTLNAARIVNNGIFNFNDAGINTDTFTNTGTFTGAGVINSLDKSVTLAFTNSGILAPGNSPGTLNITGNFIQTAAGTLEIELGSTAHDILNVSGTATLAGILNVILYDDYVPAVDSSYDFLLAAGGISGMFTSILGPSGYSWTVDYLDLTNDGVIETARLTANAVPIPPAVWLLGTGLIGIVGIRRRWVKP